ncbi:winged helix-turn-helix transcriptional regulator [Corynebacterium sp. AOP12-C2-36]|uniref:winged helix-turn-helix transcriptional regulator n=1 Tax=Corynebacterium sp. AOP12-C2-36 TaxID=3457723 RepID=UPI004033FCC9
MASRDENTVKNREWSSGDEWRGLHDLLTLISKKWAVAVLLTLRTRPLRYAQLQRAIGCGNVKTMTVTLKSLEEAGLIERKVLDGRPPGVMYEISALGRSLIGSLDPVRKWSVDNDFDADTLAGYPLSN